MELITLKQKFKEYNNFLKIFNHDKKAKQEFQRLEFLGDRVLALILSHEIYNRFTRFNEGRLEGEKKVCWHLHHFDDSGSLKAEQPNYTHNRNVYTEVTENGKEFLQDYITKWRM